jgi:hypothetical protein
MKMKTQRMAEKLTTDFLIQIRDYHGLGVLDFLEGIIALLLQIVRDPSRPKAPRSYGLVPHLSREHAVLQFPSGRGPVQTYRHQQLVSAQSCVGALADQLLL